jgi:hypothetical protein
MNASTLCIRMADVLARPAARPDFSRRDVLGFESGNIAMKWNLRPMPFQNPLTVGVNFTMERRSNPSVLETQVEAANSGEKRSKSHLTASLPNGKSTS